MLQKKEEFYRISSLPEFVEFSRNNGMTVTDIFPGAAVEIQSGILKAVFSVLGLCNQRYCLLFPLVFLTASSTRAREKNMKRR